MSGITRSGGATAHGSLTGLANDDHPQYATDTDLAGKIDATTLTTRGDLFVRGAAAVGRLGLGTIGKLLASDGTDAVWRGLSGTAGVLADLLTTRGDIITRQNVSGVARLAIGSANQVLAVTADGLDAAWTALAGLMTWAAPGASAIGDTNAAGSATTAARSDHRHTRESAAAAIAITTANAAGSSTSVARADHGHKLQGAAIQSATNATASIAAAASADVVLTWPSAFADTNYKAVAVAAYADGTNRAPPTWYLKLNAADAPTTTTITVRVTNNSAVAEVVTVHAIGIHD